MEEKNKFTVQVHVGDKNIEISVGDGRQNFKWLGNVLKF